MQPISGISGISGVGRSGFDYIPVASGVVKRNAAEAAAPEEISGENTEEIKQKKRLGVIECQTCASRTYQDGSDDPGVSFKSPTKLNPSEAASAVPAHEREHYNRESADAEENDREVVSNNIRIFTSVCLECGKTYVSGGLTTTVTKAKNKDKNELMDKIFGNGSDNEKGSNSVSDVNQKIANEAYGLNYDKKR